MTAQRVRGSISFELQIDPKPAPGPETTRGTTYGEEATSDDPTSLMQQIEKLRRRRRPAELLAGLRTLCADNPAYAALPDNIKAALEAILTKPLDSDDEEDHDESRLDSCSSLPVAPNAVPEEIDDRATQTGKHAAVGDNALRSPEESEPMQSRLGVVESFNPETRIGSIQIGPRTLGFASTCLDGVPDSWLPRPGERVRVWFQLDEITLVSMRPLESEPAPDDNGEAS